MIRVVDVETSWQVTENGGYDPSPFHPDNILVSVGIDDEYFFTNHSEKIDKGCFHKIQELLDTTTLFSLISTPEYLNVVLDISFLKDSSPATGEYL